MQYWKYEKEKLQEISFPLGGIGTGCIGLAGNGQLIDMEIFNRPNKGSHASFSHFAVKTEKSGKVIDQRVIQGDYPKNYLGNYNRPDFNCYGFGPDRASMAGFPHFKDCTFLGSFPLAKLKLGDEKFPGRMEMTAFNPFIPTNDRDSSIPGAFFEFAIENTTEEELDYSVAFSQANLYCSTSGIHTWEEKGAVKSIHMTNAQYDKTDVRYGDLTISTDCSEVSHQLYWFRGKWFDNLTTFWSDFQSAHHIKNRVYDAAQKPGDENYSAHDVATLVAHIHVKPHETGKVRFVLTWNMPNCYNYWNEKADKTPWKNYYAVLFENSLASGQYAMEHFDTLLAETALFTETLLSSTLPDEALESISANLAVMKSPTCLRLEDGSLYGFEGCHALNGSCEGSCTHVWSYTYAIPFLFPKLERSMRTLEYTYNIKENGGMSFRLMLPLGSPQWGFRPCVDGQYGTVMRVYREFKISGDLEWLKNIWPNVKRTIEFAWSDQNPDRWDADKDGLMEGRQHHTLDMELFGPNAWLSGMYLGGLKAGIEMARILGEEDTAKEYEAIFESGRRLLNEKLFNGEYFAQEIDLRSRSLLEKYQDGESLQNEDVFHAYWNDEQQEMMYQIAEGCELDQTLAQWHANLIGLGNIFDPEKARKASESIYRYNFIPNMREHVNPCRLYCLNDEGGLVICRWPEGKKKGFIPLPYAEETQNGYEYAAAIQMIQNGMIEEGMECVKAIRGRYRGDRRNPWNEFECGSNYARSMASYSLLLTFSGFQYDCYREIIGFRPLEKKESFQCFWSLDSGWGKVCCDKKEVALDILYGSLRVKQYLLEDDTPVSEVLADGKPVPFRQEGTCISFENPLLLTSRLVLQRG